MTAESRCAVRMPTWCLLVPYVLALPLCCASNRRPRSGQDREKEATVTSLTIDFQEGFDEVIQCDVNGSTVFEGRLTSDPLDEFAAAVTAAVSDNAVTLVILVPRTGKSFSFHVDLARGAYVGVYMKGNVVRMTQSPEPFLYD